MNSILLRRIELLILAFAILVQGSTSFAGAPNNRRARAPEIIPGVLYVKFKPQTRTTVQTSSAYASVLQRYSVRLATQPFTKIARSPDEEEFTRIFKFIIPQSIDVMNAVRELRNDPNIEYAEPSYVYHTSGYTPNDPSFGLMYNLAKINAAAAWDITKGDTNVVIGIVDSGTDYSHEDLAANIWTNLGETGTDGSAHDKKSNGVDDDGNGFVDDWHGWDFVGASTTWAEDNDPSPKNGNPHGTHTAGTASAVTDNGKGISSIGFKCKLMITKHGVDTPGSTAIYFGFDGILYCINNGASVVSCSWGGGGGSQFEQDVIRYGLKKNVLVVAAAGNGGDDQIGDNNEFVAQYPANYRGVLSVGATDSQDKIADFSNFGRPEYVRVFSPGVDILSTLPGNNYQSAGWSGTSMATPLVSGLAGLLKSYHPSWTAAQIMFQICGTADNVDALNPAFAGKMGYGRINAGRALTETLPPPQPEFALGSVTVNDATGGNNNGILEPGESAQLIVSLRNNWGDASGVTASLSTNQWATTVTKSSSSYGSVRGLNLVDSSLKSNSSDPFTVSISPDAVPTVIPFVVTFTAAGGYTKQFIFSIAIAPRILLVDDDDGSVNVEGYYESALQTLGASYDVWDHAKDGTPPAPLLSKYGTVIWFCEWAFPALDSSDRTSITTYLNGGGKLFLSGQDIGWDLADPTGTEYTASGGASKNFYENVIKAKFVADDAGTKSVVGVANDSIGAGYLFSRYLPDRAASEQFPDVIQPINGSVSVFNYGEGTYAGQSAAIRYNGACKIVYFSFGGIEAITDSVKRVLVLNQVLRWLGGYNAVVDKLKDTEDTSDPIPVSTTVTSASPIQSVTLYYDNDGAFPFKKTSMVLSSGKYTGSIPAQAANSNIEYFVLVKTADGYLPYLTTNFHVGPDNVPPKIVGTILKNTMNLRGPFPITATVTDGLGVDTNSIILHYSINGSAESTKKLAGNGQPDTYQTLLQFLTPLTAGDIVSYYITAQDLSVAKNQGQLPSGGAASFTAGREIVDDFEDTTRVLWNYGTWGRATKFRHQPGFFDITDSPVGTYLPNTDNTLTLLGSYDLTDYTQAQLRFYYKCIVDPSDTLYVELSNDGTTWTAVEAMNGYDAIFGPPSQHLVDIPGFTGAGNSNVKMRFRLHADGVDEGDGFYLDDVELVGGKLTQVSNSESTVLPTSFSMDQNYPNPFNPSTTIRFGMPVMSNVTLRIYDIIGREVAELVNGQLSAGYHQYQWDGSGVATGVYFCTITMTPIGGDNPAAFTRVNKLLLLK